MNGRLIDAFFVLVEHQTVAEFDAAYRWMLALPLLCKAMRDRLSASSTLKRMRWWLYVCVHRLHSRDLCSGFDSYRQVNALAVTHRFLPRISQIDNFLHRVVTNPDEPGTLEIRTTPLHAEALVTMFNQCTPECLRTLAHARLEQRYAAASHAGYTHLFILCVRPGALA